MVGLQLRRGPHGEPESRRLRLAAFWLRRVTYSLNGVFAASLAPLSTKVAGLANNRPKLTARGRSVAESLRHTRAAA